MSFTMHVELI